MHAVQRPAAAVLLQEVEEAEPFGGVDLGLALLLDVAAGGVDQHRVLGEEPVAVARAADALQVVGRGRTGSSSPDWRSAVVLPAAGGPMMTYQGISRRNLRPPSLRRFSSASTCLELGADRGDALGRRGRAASSGAAASSETNSRLARIARRWATISQTSQRMHEAGDDRRAGRSRRGEAAARCRPRRAGRTAR